MKKLMFITAIVLAALTSSFVGNSAVKSHKTTNYYWYTVNSSGQIVSGSQAFGGDAETPTYAEDNLPCPSGTDADCIRGFSSPITSFPTSATGNTTPLQKQE